MKILIVEDEKRLAQYLTRALEEAGYVVEYISDGNEALQFILDFHMDLDIILLDIFLPHISGIEICREIRKKNIALPVLMVTAKDQEEEKVQGLDIGADDYITKPFSLTELVARVRSHIRRARGEMSNVLIRNNIMIDIASKRVYISGNEVKLTLKEYNLLYLFALHPKEVLDREYIFEKLWDMNSNSYSNVVDVQVKNLRKKINDTNQKQKVIEAVRGVGFRFNIFKSS